MYGETGSVLRGELTALLRQQRTRHKPMGLSVEDRVAQGIVIRGYRQNVLIWTRQAMRAALPMAFSNMPPPQPNPFRKAGTGDTHLSAAGELARAIDLAVDRSTAQPAPADQLTTPLADETVEHWRLAARAATLAEHDTTEQISTSLTTRHAQALVSDVAAVVQALVVLDRRHDFTRDWEPIAQADRLATAAMAAALDANLGQPDYAVDHLGWRPKTKVIRGPARPGLLGVLQAEHDLVVRMKTVPNALNLRLVVDSQRLLSVGLVPFAARVDRSLANHWRARALAYSDLQRQLRDIGGLLGSGGLAVAQGATAVARLNLLPGDAAIDVRVLSGFQVLFNRLDNRIADIIETGLAHRVYFQRVTLPRLTSDNGHLVHPLRERFGPVTSANEAAVLATVRDQLRGQAAPSTRERDLSRLDLSTALIGRSRASKAKPVGL